MPPADGRALSTRHLAGPHCPGPTKSHRRCQRFGRAGCRSPRPRNHIRSRRRRTVMSVGQRSPLLDSTHHLLGCGRDGRAAGGRDDVAANRRANEPHGSSEVAHHTEGADRKPAVMGTERGRNPVDRPKPAARQSARRCLVMKREVSGEPNRIRTCDPLIKSQLLYQLSYGPITRRYLGAVGGGVNPKNEPSGGILRGVLYGGHDAFRYDRAALPEDARAGQ